MDMGDEELSVDIGLDESGRRWWLETDGQPLRYAEMILAVRRPVGIRKTDTSKFRAIIARQASTWVVLTGFDVTGSVNDVFI